MGEFELQPKPTEVKEPSVKGMTEYELGTPEEETQLTSKLEKEVEEAETSDALLSKEKISELQMQALEKAGSLVASEKAGISIIDHDAYAKSLQDLAVAQAELPLAINVLNSLYGSGFTRVKNMIAPSSAIRESRARLQEIEQTIHDVSKTKQELEQRLPMLKTIVEKEQEEKEDVLQEKFEEAA